MSVLDTIIANKQSEVAARRSVVPLRELERSVIFERTPVSLRGALKSDGSSGIIAEFKRKSPSRGWICESARVGEIVPGYESAGACAVSVLTDSRFFGGSTDDIVQARTLVTVPILRKDFVVDEYQIVEAKSIGADAVLLIAAALAPERARDLIRCAHSLGLEVLLELHAPDEIDQSSVEMADVMGVNNRDLKSMEVSVSISYEMIRFLPGSCTRVSESGIDNDRAIKELRAAGYHGFLIGECFMREEIPHRACGHLIDRLRSCGRP